MEHLWSPWRMAYLRGDDSPAATDRLPATGMLSSPGCIFCDKPRESRDRENLIVHRAERAFVILNLYPYNNGHLMVVPYQHVPSFEQLDEPALAEVMRLLNQGVAALRKVYNPQAFNLGANIGQAAGAGIADHVHMHIVPRWAGDTNYMATVAGTRVIPEDLQETYRQVQAAWPR
jgi:ATP adenylyltransferase